MRVASLGSGSEGNALIVEAGCGGTRIMLDCGFGLRECEKRLARAGLVPSDLTAVLVTHEHGDHVGGVARFARKHSVPVFMTHGTYVAAGLGGPGAFQAPLDFELTLIDTHTTFEVGDLEVLPFPVPHDAREPVQFVFRDGAARLGALTDLGASTPHVEAMLSGCNALVLECNHDAAMLAAGPYPPALRSRVGGNYGHLENGQAAHLLGRVAHPGLRHVIAAHLSSRNNTPGLAQGALAGALGCAPNEIGIADQARGFDWRSVG